MDFASFNYFSSTLIGFNKNLRNLRAFGTDGQESLIDSFGHSFPFAVQLIHMKKNMAEKLDFLLQLVRKFLVISLVSIVVAHTVMA